VVTICTTYFNIHELHFADRVYLRDSYDCQNEQLLFPYFTKLTGLNFFFVFNSCTVYCNIVFANRIESTQFIKMSLWTKLDVKTSSRRLKQDSCQNTPTQNRPPDSGLPPNADSARPHHRRHRSFVCISCYQSRHRENLISTFPASYERRTRQAWRTPAVLLGTDAALTSWSLQWR
jgi:hypothetical protein